MDSIIEIQRQTHEEIERYEQALADVLMKETKGSRETLRNQHKALDVLNRVAEKKRILREQYRDDTGIRAQELSALSVGSSSGGDELSEFYSRYEKIKESHAARDGIEPDVRAFQTMLKQLVDGDGMERRTLEDGEEVVTDPLDAMFSGEEGKGRFLDLYIPHTQYINLKSARRLNYIQYLNLLISGKVADATFEQKEMETPAYLDYVHTLHSYLLDSIRRTHPLEQGRIHAALKATEAEFSNRWEAGEVEGWQRKQGNTANGDPEASQTNGGETNGVRIWCAACQKHYSKQTVYDAHLTSKKHVKAAEKLAASGKPADPSDPQETASLEPSSAQNLSKSRRAALLTNLTHKLLETDPLPQLLNDTKQNVERKSALTAREREQELEEAEEEQVAADEADGEEDDDGRIYNPLKLPLGWDGKPIPFWLYKLHGLGVEYKCEICSDYVYMGRKAFDRHFQESRHAFGMRALGLPNTKHFHEITKISDALALADKLKREGRQEQYQVDRTEEFEDAEGNV